MEPNTDITQDDLAEAEAEKGIDAHIKDIAIEEYEARILDATFDAEVLAMFDKDIGDLMAALGRAQVNYKPMKMTGLNPYFSSKYSTYDDMVDSTRTALQAEGLTITHIEIKDKVGDGFFLYTILYHSESGQYLLQSAPMYAHMKPEFQMEPDQQQYAGGDRGYEQKKPKRVNKSQAIGSELSYNKRYHYALVAGVSLGTDDDAEALAEEVKNGNGKQQYQQPKPKEQAKDQPADTGKREQSVSEKSAWAAATDLNIAKDKMKTTLIEQFNVKVLKDLKPAQWQRAAQQLNKIKGRANSVSRILDIEFKTFVAYVSETSSWHTIDVAMDGVIKKEAPMIEGMMQAMSNWMTAKEAPDANQPAKPAPEQEAKPQPENSPENGASSEEPK